MPAARRRTEHADEIRVATPDEVQALVNVVDDRWKALVLTAAYSGLRCGELTGLRRRDIRPDGTTITVSVQLSEIKNKIELDAPPKTAAGKRTVTLPDVDPRRPANRLGVPLVTHDGIFCGAPGLDVVTQLPT